MHENQAGHEQAIGIIYGRERLERITIDLLPQGDQKVPAATAPFPDGRVPGKSAREARLDYWSRRLLRDAWSAPLFQGTLFACPPPAPRSRWHRLRDRVNAWRWRLAACRRILSGRWDFDGMPWDLDD